MVVDKPSGWLSVPASQELGEARSKPDVLSWVRAQKGAGYAVHRLDVETTGVLIVALTAESHRKLSMAFEGRDVKKHYECLALGKPDFPMFKGTAAVSGRPATTQFTVLSEAQGAFLAQARPLTGRRHQIRIHLSGLGHPILGDRTYGGPTEWGGTEIPRVALHARRLEIPGFGAWEAPRPPDFVSWLGALGIGGSA